MRNFCTLFDSNYRVKGLALHQSLLEKVGDFHLYILCLDDTLLGLLSQLKMAQTTLIPFADFADSAIMATKTKRTPTEWIWTMTPSLPLFVLERYPEIAEIAYVDADLYFFGSPQPMYAEIEASGQDSMVIPHRFPPDRAKTENGLYNVSLVWWRRCPKTLEQLRHWRGQCLDWCHYYPIVERGWFADQGYLNDWPQTWGSHVLQHEGCNVAPWNMGLYDYFFQNEMDVWLKRPGGEERWPLVFFHFHEFRITNEWTHQFFRTNYPRPAFVDKHIYEPYEKALGKQIERIRPYVHSTR